MFFILAGMELNVAVLSQGMVVLYGIIYILARFGGKLTGVFCAARITKAPPEVRKYLGLCLFPQAGVAIGLVLFVETSPVLAQAGPLVRESLDLILNIVLVSVFINELFGPSISRYGIVKGAKL
jgi:Kef-type K+ transport system membrane component KefB